MLHCFLLTVYKDDILSLVIKLSDVLPMLAHQHPLLQHQGQIFPPSTSVLKRLIVCKTQYVLLGVPVLCSGCFLNLFQES